MNRAMRKRLQRLLDGKPPAIHRGDRQREVVDTLYAQQYTRTLELLAGFKGDNAPQVAVELSQSLHRACREAWEVAAQEFPEAPPKIHCKQGCSWCCHEPLQVHILDAIGVAAAGQAPLDYTLETRERLALKKIFKPCPMLVEGQCSVYEQRPVICRAYHSTDVAACQRVVESQDGGRQIPMDLRLYGYTGLPQEATLRVFEELGIDRQPVVLGLAVAALGRDFAAMTTDWLSGGDAFEPVRVL